MPEEKKVIVVTGASAGLGRSIARLAGRRGIRVLLMARNEDAMKKIQAEITTGGGEAVPVATDVGDPVAVQQAFDKATELWYQIDILFNCAGVVEPVAPLVRNSDEELIRSLMTNVYGVYICTREALKRMRNQTHGGTIVNVASGAANHPYVGWSAYGSQKAAVDTFTKIVGLEVEDLPIRIFALSPGPFQSHMQAVLRNSDKENFPAKERFIKIHKENKLVSAEEVANVFLDISLTEWPELSGTIRDIRSKKFQQECKKYGVQIPTEYFSGKE